MNTQKKYTEIEIQEIKIRNIKRQARALRKIAKIQIFCGYVSCSECLIGTEMCKKLNDIQLQKYPELSSISF